MIHHDGVGLFDAALELRFFRCAEPFDLSEVAKHMPLRLQGIANEIGDHNRDGGMGGKRRGRLQAAGYRLQGRAA